MFNLKHELCFSLCLVQLLAACCAAAAPTAANSVTEHAAQLYPGHTLLQLSPNSTSSIQTALQAALKTAQQPAVLVVLHHPAGEGVSLVVDQPLVAKDGLSLVVATPAALQAAAAAGVAAASSRLRPQELLVVRCRSSKGSGFLQADGAAAVELLGLSIQGCPSSAVVATSTDRLLLQDMTLSGNNKVVQADKGGALQAEDVASVTLARVTCSHNFALIKGGCLSATRVGTVLIAGSTFTGNEKSLPDAEGGGGAISLELTQLLSVASSSFADNVATGSNNKGGAIRGFLSGPIVVTDSHFENNTAEMQGGAIHGGDVGPVNITNCTFTRNGMIQPPEPPGGDAYYLPTFGGAVSVVGNRLSAGAPVRLTIRGCRFDGNVAEDGGAIATNQWGPAAGQLEVCDSVFVNNQVWNRGGAVFNAECRLTNALLSGSQFQNNTATTGGSLYIYDSQATINNCSFTKNKATDGDGGAIVLQSGMSGGTRSKLALSYVRLAGNSAQYSGGAMCVLGGYQLSVADSDIVGNTAGLAAGGVSVASVSEVQFTHSRVINNTASEGAGGLQITGAATTSLQHVTLTANKGRQGGGLSMQAVSMAALSAINASSNAATQAGGGLVLTEVEQAAIQDSSISGNSAPLGGGLASDSTTLQLQRVAFSTNWAEPPGIKAAAPVLLQFESLMHPQGSAGAALVQRSNLSMYGCRVVHNAAEWDAGSLLLQHPAQFILASTMFHQNTVNRGVGGALVVRGAGTQVGGVMRDCSFSDNVAEYGSGGALVLDSGLGPLEVECDGCSFHGNRAAQDGGAVAATGPTTFSCRDCQSGGNTAAHSGGWLSCSGCSSASLAGGSSSNNRAIAGAGGAVSCQDCGSFKTSRNSYSSNSATAGGAVALQATANVEVANSSFAHNQATTGAAAAGAASGSSSKRLQLASRLPLSWQVLYNVGAAAAASKLGCSSLGSGGGLCVADSTHASISDTSLVGNTGGTGGAMFASAALCSNAQADVGSGAADSSTSSSSCLVKVTNVSAAGNAADEAGGALYTSTPQSVQLRVGSAGAAWPASPAKVTQVLQQLERDNSVAAGSYGAGAASSPATLSFLRPTVGEFPAPCNSCSSNRGTSSDQPASAKLVSRQPSQQHGNQQQQVGASGQAQPAGRKLLDAQHVRVADVLQKASEYAWHEAFGEQSSNDEQGAGLDPTCPPLGATVLEGQTVGVDAYQVFSLPVYIVDAFGSQVSRGPGSDWVVQLEESAGGGAAGRAGLQLSGATRGRLSAGAVLLEGLNVAAQPGSQLQMQLTAAPRRGTAGHAVFTNVTMEVRPCLPGQAAGFSNESGSIVQTCYMCPAPLFSFSAYTSGSSGSSNASFKDGTSLAVITQACFNCPPGGICVAGMVIPESGTYQAHPRSKSIMQCPHRAACTRDGNAMSNLQGLQCAFRRLVDASAIEPEPYTALQCSRGYAGPFCSCCYRSGRSKWLAQQHRRQRQQLLQLQKGYAVAGEGLTLAAPLPAFDPSESYGRSSGRCSRCRHIALAWVGFLLVRLLDMAFVSLLAWLWLIFGWLGTLPATSALRRLKQQRMRALKFRKMASLSTLSSGIRSLMSMGRHSNAAKAFADMQPTPSQRLAAGDDGLLLQSSMRGVDQQEVPAADVAAGGMQDKPGPHVRRPPVAVRSTGNLIPGPGASRLVPRLLDASGTQQQQGRKEGAMGLAHAKPRAPARRSISMSNVLMSRRQLTRVLDDVITEGLPAQHDVSARSDASGTTAGWNTDQDQDWPAHSASPFAAAANAAGFADCSSQHNNQHRAFSHSFPASLRAAGSFRTAGSLTTPQLSRAASRAGSTSSSTGMQLQPQSSAFYALHSAISTTWSSAVRSLQQMDADVGGGGQLDDGQARDALTAQHVALLLMAVRYLASMAQVILDCGQLAAVVLAQDLLWQVPDWAATGISAVLITQQTTWQWVPFECMIPGSSGASGAALQAVLVMLLPVLYVAILLPLMVWLKDSVKKLACKHGYASEVLQSLLGTADAVSITAASQGVSPGLTPASSMGFIAADATCHSAADQLPQQHQQRQCVKAQCLDACSNLNLQQQQQQQQPARSQWLQRFWPLKRSTWMICTALCVASMAYCFSFYVATVVGAFSCMRLAGKASLPGEANLHGTVWVSDLQLQCWHSPGHMVVAAIALLVGVPLLLAYCWLLLVLSWPVGGGHQDPFKPEEGEGLGSSGMAAASSSAAAGGKQAKGPAAQQLQHQVLLSAPAAAPAAAGATDPSAQAGAGLVGWGSQAMARAETLVLTFWALPAGWVQPYVRVCQQRLDMAGVSGMHCAGLGVWEVRWRWYWLLCRELIKAVVVLAATANSMRAPNTQALLVLMFVVMAAAVTWQRQPCGCTTMARLLFVGWLWVQGLSLLVLLLALPNVDGAVFGGVLLGMLVAGVVQVVVVTSALLLRCVTAARGMGDAMQAAQ